MMTLRPNSQNKNNIPHARSTKQFVEIAALVSPSGAVSERPDDKNGSGVNRAVPAFLRSNISLTTFVAHRLQWWSPCLVRRRRFCDEHRLRRSMESRQNSTEHELIRQYAFARPKLHEIDTPVVGGSCLRALKRNAKGGIVAAWEGHYCKFLHIELMKWQ